MPCANCGSTEGPLQSYEGYAVCQDCRATIGHRQPQAAPERSPHVIWKTAVSDFAAWAAEASKAFKAYGYYYRCYACFRVTIDANRLCFCGRPKEFNRQTLSPAMPLGWA